MIHEYQYLITPEMQRASVRDYFFKLVLRKRWINLIFLVALGAACLKFDDGWIRNYGYAVLGISIFLIISWVKTYYAYIRMADSHYEMLNNGNITLGLNDEGVHYRSANGDKFFSWEKFNDVKESKSYIWLLRGKIPIVVIPKSEIDNEGLTMMRTLNSIVTYSE